MEEALRESEEKYHNIFENAVMGIIRTTPEGRILESNIAMARICGYDSPGEMIDAYTDIGAELYVYPEERNRLGGLLENYGFTEHFETQFYRKDCSKIWISMNVRAVREPGGMIIFHEGTVEDITVRKQAEEALRATHQRLSDIIEFLPDATFVIDDEKKVVAWNRACEEMTKIGKEEIIGKSDFIYSVPFYGDKRPMLIDYVAKGSCELPDYLGPIKRNGNRLYAEKYTPEVYGGKGAYLSGEASPLFDREGNTVGAIESLRDITELRHLETQLRQSQKMEAIGTLQEALPTISIISLQPYGVCRPHADKDGEERSLTAVC
jgi:PAS domain S-box-containing protein